MQIKQDPVTCLWVRQDGAILMPPTSKYSNFKKFRGTFGCRHRDGYCSIVYKGKHYLVHPIICRAFHGPAPEGKPETDHINRIRDDNRSCNLRYADRSLNNTNRGCVDRSIEKYGVRYSDDPDAYMKTYNKNYNKAHREEIKAYNAAKAAKMKAQGLHYCKGPNGKAGWYPRIRP